MGQALDAVRMPRTPRREKTTIGGGAVAAVLLSILLEGGAGSRNHCIAVERWNVAAEMLDELVNCSPA